MSVAPGYARRSQSWPSLAAALSSHLNGQNNYSTTGCVKCHHIHTEFNREANIQLVQHWHAPKKYSQPCTNFEPQLYRANKCMTCFFDLDQHSDQTRAAYDARKSRGTPRQRAPSNTPKYRPKKQASTVDAGSKVNANANYNSKPALNRGLSTNFTSSTTSTVSRPNNGPKYVRVGQRTSMNPAVATETANAATGNTNSSNIGNSAVNSGGMGTNTAAGRFTTSKSATLTTASQVHAPSSNHTPVTWIPRSNASATSTAPTPAAATTPATPKVTPAQPAHSPAATVPPAAASSPAIALGASSTASLPTATAQAPTPAVVSSPAAPAPAVQTPPVAAQAPTPVASPTPVVATPPIVTSPPASSTSPQVTPAATPSPAVTSAASSTATTPSIGSPAAPRQSAQDKFNALLFAKSTPASPVPLSSPAPVGLSTSMTATATSPTSISNSAPATPTPVKHRRKSIGSVKPEVSSPAAADKHEEKHHDKRKKPTRSTTQGPVENKLVESKPETKSKFSSFLPAALVKPVGGLLGTSSTKDGHHDKPLFGGQIRQKAMRPTERLLPIDVTTIPPEVVTLAMQRLGSKDLKHINELIDVTTKEKEALAVINKYPDTKMTLELPRQVSRVPLCPPINVRKIPPEVIQRSMGKLTPADLYHIQTLMGLVEGDSSEESDGAKEASDESGEAQKAPTPAAAQQVPVATH